MKNLFFYFILLHSIVINSFVNAQNNQNTITILDGCATNQLHISNNLLRQAQNNLDIQASNYIQTHQNSSNKVMNNVITIPTVVHIIHNNGVENISDAQVNAAILQLNTMFMAHNGTQIQFCLAQRDPMNNATNGITRTVSPLTVETMETDDIILKNLNRWNPNQYLNIWVVQEILSASMGSGVVGYAYFPSAHGLNMDGIVMEANFFGVSTQTTAVLAHEVGHYLGLYHTFENGCTNNNCLNDGDKVCDTPPDQAVHASCVPTVNSCHTDLDDTSSNNPLTTDINDFGNNYMDYSPLACYNAFTAGQYTRMEYFLNNIRGSLISSLGCNSPCPNPLTATISANSTNISLNTTVNFTGTATNSSSYQFYIQPSTILSTSTTFAYNFSTVGVYWVKFKALSSNPTMCLSAIDSIKITIMQPSNTVCSGSIHFDDNNAGANLPASNQYYSANNGGYTWETWFKLDPLTTTASVRPLIAAVDATTFEDIWLGFGWSGGWYDEPVNRLVFKVDGANSAIPYQRNCSYEPVGGFIANQWYHAAGVMDYSTQKMKLFVNGILVDSLSQIATPNTRVIETHLSYDWSGGIIPLYGNMDEVRIWDRPLSDAEIGTYYNQCRAGNEPNLLVYYKANQSAGNIITDITANHLDGILSNNTGWSNDAATLVGAACTNTCACATTVTIPISTGIDNNQNALAIGMPDPNWHLVNTVTLDTITALSSSYYSGFWEVTPVISTNAGWINTSGSAYNGNMVGIFNYERKFNVTAAVSLECDFQMAWDDDLTHLVLVSPSNVVTPLPFIRSGYLLGYRTNTVINNPETGVWTLRATLNHIDEAAGLLVSGNIILNTSINAGNDTTICNGLVNLNATTGFDAYQWTPAMGLSNTTINNPIATPTTTTTYTVQGIKNIGSNLVYNGDFSLGNVGFTTQYTFGNFTPNNYNVAYTFFNINGHPQVEHTGNNGNYMSIDGSYNPNQIVWEQTIPIIEPNTNYLFSYWALADLPAAVLQLKINNTIIKVDSLISNCTPTQCDWFHYNYIWNSENNTSATIQIIDLNTDFGGNDFGLDDISFTQACVYTDSITITINNTPVPALNLGADIATCNTAAQVLDAGVGFSTYLWQDGSTNQTFTAYTAGLYSVIVSDACGNTQQDSITITTITPPSPNITATSTTITPSQCVTLIASASTNANFQWNNTMNSTTSNITECPTTTTTYTVNADYGNGCLASDSITINVVSCAITARLDTVYHYGCNNFIFSTSITRSVCDSVSYFYDFGDGITATTGNFTTHYYNNGTYTACVTTTLHSGTVCSASSCITIIVRNPTIAIITSSDSTICAGDTIRLSSGMQNGSMPYIYIWNTGETSRDIQITSAGVYTVTITDANGCSATAQTTIGNCVDTYSQDSYLANIKIYPNPIQDFIYIKHPETVQDIQIIDILGKILVRKAIYHSSETRIDTSILPQGVYFIWIDGKQINKVIK